VVFEGVIDFNVDKGNKRSIKKIPTKKIKRIAKSEKCKQLDYRLFDIAILHVSKKIIF
jgi:hypothetical protein